jgi:hypothetical protein
LVVVVFGGEIDFSKILREIGECTNKVSLLKMSNIYEVWIHERRGSMEVIADSHDERPREVLRELTVQIQ